MMRRFLLVAAAIPLATAGIIHGCSSEPPIEDMCRWLGETENCYREFHEDLPTACGFLKGADNQVPAAAKGHFLSPAMLDNCVLEQGGSIKFDPALDPGTLPLQTPLKMPLKMTILDATGQECGSVSWSDQFSFSFTVNPPPGFDAGAPSADGGVDSGADAGCADASDESCEPKILFGTVSAITPEGRSTLDVTCADGKSHHFDRLQVDDDFGCRNYLQIVPQAILDATPGSIGHDGVLRLTIFYPPGNDTDITKPTAPVAADQVVYFECAIPGPKPPCADGMKNNSETDVDCGGTEALPFCPARCESGKLCAVDCDCGDGLSCQVDPMDGVKKCTAGNKMTTCKLICSDGMKDSNETDVDCGGGCPGCPDGLKCATGTDCQSMVCTAGVCTSPNCMDGAKNGTETGVDCGGPCPNKCKDGEGCNSPADCMINGCFNGVCSACGDAKQDGTESDIDCGGTCGPTCTDGKKCNGNADCVSNQCDAMHVCISCKDGIKNGSETATDCGGGVCPKCAQGIACNSNADCADGVCTMAKICDTCGDKVKDGSETDVDCGGNCGATCTQGKGCKTNADCAMNSCNLMTGKCN